VKSTTTVRNGTEAETTTTTTIGVMQDGKGAAPGSEKQDEQERDDGQDEEQDGTANIKDSAAMDDEDVEESKLSKAKKPASYLDEILLQRDKKKKNKNKKKRDVTMPKDDSTAK